MESCLETLVRHAARALALKSRLPEWRPARLHRLSLAGGMMVSDYDLKRRGRNAILRCNAVIARPYRLFRLLVIWAAFPLKPGLRP